MCGIAGIYNKDNRPVDENILAAMRDSLIHRGPDGYGSFTEGNVGLAHRRLSIIDLSENAAQPFSSADGRYHITFNGEIFNFQYLKEELVKDGIMFRSSSDTEVLLYMYIKYGIEVLDKLNGMFAFAIWDSREKELFIARDRVGIKPLYYSTWGGDFYFASEPKAIFKAGVPATLNDDCYEELLLFRYIAGENTIFKNVKRLLPGHKIRIKNGVMTFRRWWDLPSKILNFRENKPKDPFAWFEETFYDSVKLRTISDVPVGVMLSGGLDSSSVAYALHKNGITNLSSFTMGFDEESYNEEPLARLVADKYGLNFNSMKLKGEEMFNMFAEAAYLYDEPMVHQNDAQMLALSKFAKKKVTVLLTGEGADEMMGGYVRYKSLLHYNKLKPFRGMLRSMPFHGQFQRLNKLKRYYGVKNLDQLVMLNASNIYPSDLEKFGWKTDMERFEYRVAVQKEARSLYPKDPARQAMYADKFIHMSSVLDRNDRMTMGAGIECRVPFMDYRFLEGIPGLPSSMLLKGKKGKYLLFNSVAKNLPEEIRKFRKIGFAVPWENYIRRDVIFNRFFNSMTNEKRILEGEIFEKTNIPVLVKGFHQNDHLSQSILRQFLMISIWKKYYLEKI